MFVEDLETLPEALRDQFVPFELDGKKGFQDIETQKAYALVQTVKGEKKAVQDKFAEVEGRLSAFEQGQAEAIEKAKAEALEQARTSGDIEAIEARYKEQMADVEKRAEARGKELAGKEYSIKEARLVADSEFDKIVKELNPLSREHETLLRDHLKSRQSVTEDGSIVYLNLDGSASSLDANGFLSEAKELPTVKALIKAETATFGGGGVNGSNRGGATSTAGNFGGDKKARIAAINQKFNLG